MKNKYIDYDENGLIICKLCGESFKKLGGHIAMKHDITTKEYRIKFGIPMRSRLMCEESIILARLRNEENKDLVVNENLIEKGKTKRFGIGDNKQGRPKGKYFIN